VRCQSHIAGLNTRRNTIEAGRFLGIRPVIATALLIRFSRRRCGFARGLVIAAALRVRRDDPRAGDDSDPKSFETFARGDRDPLRKGGEQGSPRD
jgi:hypothetical protein